MKSNDIKILKIKPIKQTTREFLSSDNEQNWGLNFSSDTNFHFFKSSLSPEQLLTNKTTPTAYSLDYDLGEFRLDLNHPYALDILRIQVRNLEQEINEIQGQNKLSQHFDEKALQLNEKYIEEISSQPVFTKGTEVNQQDLIKLKRQAREVAQKIINNEKLLQMQGNNKASSTNFSKLINQSSQKEIGSPISAEREKN